MIKNIKNLIQSINIGWNHLYFTNKIILFIYTMPSVIVGNSYLIKDLIWLINKIVK